MHQCLLLPDKSGSLIDATQLFYLPKLSFEPHESSRDDNCCSMLPNLFSCSLSAIVDVLSTELFTQRTWWKYTHQFFFSVTFGEKNNLKPFIFVLF